MEQDIPRIDANDLIERYEVLLLDAYGVLVDSSGARPGARHLIDHLNNTGKAYYIVTNDSSRLPTTASERYRSFGLCIDAERIVVSGSLLGNHFLDNSLNGANCVVLGTEDSTQYVVHAGGRIVSLADPFDVLAIGAVPKDFSTRAVEQIMNTLFRRFDSGSDVHLILMNPDLLYPSGPDRFRLAAGSLALVLEAALALRYLGRPEARFVRLGKPHSAMFEEVRRRSGTMSMVMIGDQVETDVRGANDFGIDSVLLGTGIVGATDSLPVGLRPTYRMHALGC